MWSDAPESIIHGVDLKQQDRSYNSFLVCAKETLEDRMSSWISTMQEDAPFAL